MLDYHCKGQRRRVLDFERYVGGEPKANRERNRTLNCKYKAGEGAHRNKGRNRFKTGHKTRRKNKTVVVS